MAQAPGRNAVSLPYIQGHDTDSAYPAINEPLLRMVPCYYFLFVKQSNKSSSTNLLNCHALTAPPNQPTNQPNNQPNNQKDQVEFTVKPEEDLILEGKERTITRVHAGIGTC